MPRPHTPGGGSCSTVVSGPRCFTNLNAGKYVASPPNALFGTVMTSFYLTAFNAWKVNVR